jgi:hypothetical protein
VIAYVWLVVGFAADVVFNIVRGTWTFREFPQEFLFSRRVQRHFRNKGGGWRHEKAKRWATLLNAIDPDHIHEPRE